MILGFLGSGKMASALAQGVIKSGVVKAGDLLISDVHAATAEKLANATGASVTITVNATDLTNGQVGTITLIQYP